MAIKGEINGTQTWDSACISTVEFRTNGPQGGDSGHGGFLEVTFTNLASTQMEAIVNGKKFEVQSLTLKFLGDDEMSMASKYFDFLGRKLKAIRQFSCRN